MPWPRRRNLLLLASRRRKMADMGADIFAPGGPRHRWDALSTMDLCRNCDVARRLVGSGAWQYRSQVVFSDMKWHGLRPCCIHPELRAADKAAKHER